MIVDRHSDREPLDEYINKKREMFLVQVNQLYRYVVIIEFSTHYI